MWQTWQRETWRGSTRDIGTCQLIPDEASGDIVTLVTETSNLLHNHMRENIYSCIFKIDSGYGEISFNKLIGLLVYLL